MGNNAAYTAWEQTVIDLANADALTIDVLDKVSEVYRDTDIDSGGSRDLLTDDGKGVIEVCMELLAPDIASIMQSNHEMWSDAEWDDYYWHWIDRNIEDELDYPKTVTTHHVTVTPESKQRLMREHGLTEDDFITVDDEATGGDDS